MAWMLATLSAVTVVVAIFLIAIGMAMLAVPVAILFVILAAAAAFDAIMARRKLARHGGDLDSVEADENDALPTMVSDEEAPLGATSQAHEDSTRTTCRPITRRDRPSRISRAVRMRVRPAKIDSAPATIREILPGVFHGPRCTRASACASAPTTSSRWER